ncbi:MAG: helix-turn-helix domain-containing protein [Patescibacteria group bacterium]
MPLEKTLKNYGLNEKQAKVYLACLELGSSSVQKISQKSGLARSTCYEILESLHKLGAITTYKKKKVRYFSPEDPHKIVQATKDKIELFEDALPQLRALYRQAAHQPTVRFYQGQEQMKIILKEIIGEAKQIYSFNSIEDNLALFGNYWTKFVDQRIKKKIPVKVILFDSSQARQRQEKGLQELREVKIISDKYTHHSLMLIWGNKIAIFSLKKQLVALVIESDEIAETLKMMFEFMWTTGEFIQQP